MESLFRFAEELEVEDEIRWVGVDSDVVNFSQKQPYEITNIDRRGSRIEIEAESEKEVPVGFWVGQGGENEVWYNEDQVKVGELRRAEVPAKDLIYIR